jgi:hypothetical protein
MYGPRDGKTTCARIEFMKSEAMDDVDLDDVVTIVVTGKVKRLEGVDHEKRPDYSTEVAGGGKKYKPPKEKNITIPGSVELEITEMHVANSDEWDKNTEKMEKD